MFMLGDGVGTGGLHAAMAQSAFGGLGSGVHGKAWLRPDSTAQRAAGGSRPSEHDPAALCLTLLYRRIECRGGARCATRGFARS